MTRRSVPPSASNDDLASLPIDDELWRQVIREMKLSPQQARIIELLLRKMKYKDIAQRTDLSVHTVRTYLQRVFLKHRVADRDELLIHIMTVTHRLMKRDPRPHKG